MRKGSVVGVYVRGIHLNPASSVARIAYYIYILGCVAMPIHVWWIVALRWSFQVYIHIQPQSVMLASCSQVGFFRNHALLLKLTKLVFVPKHENMNEIFFV